jgi:hypothetical protein
MAHQRPLDRRLDASVKGHDLVSNQTVRFSWSATNGPLLFRDLPDADARPRTTVNTSTCRVGLWTSL